MRKIYCSLLVVLLVISFSGCATTGTSAGSAKTQERLDIVETRLQKLEKGQMQLENLVVNQVSLQSETADGYESSAILKSVIANPSKKDIQIALKNAGYYSGSVDGKIGPKTSNAIMEFQKDNGLKVDGVVGKNTWESLGQYYKSE